MNANQSFCFLSLLLFLAFKRSWPRSTLTLLAIAGTTISHTFRTRYVGKNYHDHISLFLCHRILSSIHHLFLFLTNISVSFTTLLCIVLDPKVTTCTSGCRPLWDPVDRPTLPESTSWTFIFLRITPSSPQRYTSSPSYRPKTKRDSSHARTLGPFFGGAAWDSFN